MEKAHTKAALKVKDELNKDILYDKFKTTQKPVAKEHTKPQEFKLHTSQRAYKRAMFNYSVATKIYLDQLQKKQIERVKKIIEEEEVRTLRKEMIPRAQLMPFFDRPFNPQRSNRPLTIPREPSFHMINSKSWNCHSAGNEVYHFQSWNY
ncbi:microtubule-destabilizing protein 60 [Mercurialis annua]|uniref:microtubule-destabilizing protein 60 n=1 Tax=Mercurialis annua TaxID=3986 RepID=UPI0021602A14|nr:microtubule-destabilizing protein 60 [Mercurialis annua]